MAAMSPHQPTTHNIMAQIRIVALDLDGTLLDSSKNLSKANYAALSAAAEKGVLVVPTTGRFFGAMPQPIRDLPFVRYAITINGAQVYDRIEDKALIREEIPLAMALDLIRLLDEYDVIYDCYKDNWGWMTASLQDKAELYAPDIHYTKMIRELRNPVPELKEYLISTGGDVQKVLLFARDMKVREEIAAIVKERFPRINISASTPNNLEFNIDSAHKGVAVKRFAEIMGYTLENCMSFGDGLNDMTMIKAAGIGVAMANACPEILAAADYVTASNDDDGVAKALQHFGVI